MKYNIFKINVCARHTHDVHSIIITYYLSYMSHETWKLPYDK